MDILKLFNSVQELTAAAGQLILTFSILFAVLQCFFGYKLLKLWIGLIGFLIGFALGFFLARALVNGEAYVPALVGIVVGLVFALLAFRIYLIGVFVYCGAIAASAVHALPLPGNDGWDVMGIVFCILAFLAVGYLSTKFSRPFIIAVTAATGAVRVAGYLRGMADVLDNQIFGWLIIIVLTVAGMAVQFRTTSGRRR